MKSRQFQTLQLRANKGFVGSHYNDKLYIHVLNVELYIQVLYDKQNVFSFVSNEQLIHQKNFRTVKVPHKPMKTQFTRRGHFLPF